MKVLALLAALIAPATFGASVFGDLGYSFTFHGGGNVTLSGAGSGSTNTSTGTVLGANFTQTLLSASAPVSNEGTFSATAQMNLSAGSNTSFNSAIAEAYSDVLRVTNTGAATNFFYDNLATISMSAQGPDFASISFLISLQTWNGVDWVSVFNGSAGISEGESDTACAAGCSSSSSLSIGANTTKDYRVYVRLMGSAEQGDSPVSPTPEPSTLGMLGIAGLGLALLKRKRR